MDSDTATRQATISVPESMDDKTAQEVFLHGLRTMSAVYHESAVVTFGLEGDSKGLASYAFKGAEGAALVSFVQEVMELNPKPWPEHKKEIETVGGSLLEDLNQSQDSPAPAGEPPTPS